MRYVANPRPAAQLQLFRAAPSGPQWAQLPREIRQHSVKLLARLLREHWARRHQLPPAEELRDE
jgi:hypothetical protein